MKTINHNPEPNDAAIRRSIKPVISYPIDNLPNFDEDFYKTARKEMNLIESIIIPPRDAKTFEVPAGYFFRIISREAVSYTHLTLPTKRIV